jgi:hypothetical protein
LIEVFLPLVPLAEVMIGDDEQGVAGGGEGRADKLHVGFSGGLAGFLPIAVGAGADDVFPGVLAAPIAGYDVVEGEVAAFLSAVLAGVFVPIEYLVAGHLSATSRSPDKLGETDNRGELDGGIDGVDIAKAVLNHLRFALEDEDDGAAGAADGERLIALVEDEDGMVNHRFFHR